MIYKSLTHEHAKVSHNNIHKLRYNSSVLIRVRTDGQTITIHKHSDKKCK